MPSIGPAELVIVLVIALLVLGPKRLPAAGRGIGRGMREFKDGLLGHEDAEPRALRDPAGAEAPGVAGDGTEGPPQTAAPA
jgi:sec-independent protein translocase protein TatA